MQKLVYVKPNGNYGNPDDCVSLKFGTPFILEKLSGVSGFEETFVSAAVGNVDGTLVQHIRTEAREVPASVWVCGSDRAEMYENRFKLISALSNTQQPGTLYYSNDYITVKADAYPMLPGDFSDRVKNYNKCNIKFYCPYPCWSDTEPMATEMSYHIEENAFSFPLVFQDTVCFAENSTTTVVYCNSSVPTPVTITLVGTLVSPIVRNETPGEQIEISDVNLNDGDSLTISTKKGAKSVTLYKDGVTTDAFNLVTPTSVFWQLQPGKNVITYTSNKSISAATLVLSYYNQYRGV